MITTGAVVEWRHRTDARPEAEQQMGAPMRVEDAQALDALADHPKPDRIAAEPPPEDDPTQFRAGEPVDDIGDGIDPNALPEEDDSEVGEPVS
jgi:hypothetical protein